LVTKKTRRLLFEQSGHRRHPASGLIGAVFVSAERATPLSERSVLHEEATESAQPIRPAGRVDFGQAATTVASACPAIPTISVT